MLFGQKKFLYLGQYFFKIKSIYLTPNILQKQSIMVVQNFYTPSKDLNKKNACAAVNIVWIGIPDIIKIFFNEKKYNEPETYYYNHIAAITTFSAIFKFLSRAKSILKWKMQIKKIFATLKTAKYET